MIRYHVKHSKKSRNTLRYFGLFLVLFAALVLFLFFSGKASEHIFGAILGGLIGLYGAYIFIHSFERDKYDIDYEFNDEGMKVIHRWGETTYTYAQINDATLIVPENENVYTLIHVKAGRDKYLIPFTGKKDLCDQIYKLLTEHVLLRDLMDEIEQVKKSSAADKEEDKPRQ